MNHLLIVAAGGAVGSAMRHLFGLAALRAFGPNFPIGTLLINILGCLTMGLFIALLVARWQGSTELRLLVATGFLGGFTTFSAFSLDFAVLWERGQAGPALLYVGLSVILSLAAVFLGLGLGRALA